MDNMHTYIQIVKLLLANQLQPSAVVILNFWSRFSLSPSTRKEIKPTLALLKDSAHLWLIS